MLKVLCYGKFYAIEQTLIIEAPDINFDIKLTGDIHRCMWLFSYTELPKV